MDLTEAYKRAKPMYNGRLEHTFVVLHEEKDVPEASGSNAEPIGAKRPGAEISSSSMKKKAK